MLRNDLRNDLRHEVVKYDPSIFDISTNEQSDRYMDFTSHDDLLPSFGADISIIKPTADKTDTIWGIPSVFVHVGGGIVAGLLIAGIIRSLMR